MRKIGFLMFCLFLSGAIMAETVPQGEPMKLLEKMTPAERETMGQTFCLLRYNTFLQQFRMKYVYKPGQRHIAFFAPLNGVRWERTLKSQGFTPVFWSDFFMGCVTFSGPFSESEAVSVLYNPWWDAVLHLKLEYRKWQGNDDRKSVKITSFAFQSGEDFRKEKTSAFPKIDSVVAAKGCQAAAWMRLIAATRKAFNEQYGSASCNQTFDNSFFRSDAPAVQLRAALRIKLLQGMLSNKGVAAEMLSYLTLIRKASMPEIVRVFPDPFDQKMFALLCVLGPKYRKTISCYGYWGTEKERLYLFISSWNPCICCMVYVHVERNSREFEWVELDSSEKYLKLIDLKEMAK